MEKFFLIISGIIFWLASFFQKPGTFLSPVANETFSENPGKLAKYSFDNLSVREYPGSEIKFEKVLKNEDQFRSYLFSYLSGGKKVTGLLNMPLRSTSSPPKTGAKDKLPVIVMLRGYVDLQIYQTGTGTKKPAEFFARNGFITLAPDFLGYGGSDPEEKDILVNRFERPVTVLDLLASIKTLPQADIENIFLWGHSNGGQIALSVLEISGKNIPTSLWAPVTRGFPESVLNYSAQLDDNGKMVAERIAEFEKEHDPKEFSISEYFEIIKAPLQIQLGTYDEYIKQEWVEEFVEKMKSVGNQVDYYTYPRNNHQLSRDWDTVVQKDLEFFRKNLK